MDNKQAVLALIALSGVTGCQRTSSESDQEFQQRADRMMENDILAFPDGQDYRIVFDENQNLRGVVPFYQNGWCYFTQGNENLCPYSDTRAELSPDAALSFRMALNYQNSSSVLMSDARRQHFRQRRVQHRE